MSFLLCYCSKIAISILLITTHVATANDALKFEAPNAEYYDDNTVTDYSESNTRLRCTKDDSCVRIKHNGTLSISDVEHVNLQFDIKLSDAGTYTCESYNVPVNVILSEESCINNVNDTVASDIKNKTLLVIDSSLINIPPYQFVFVNESYSLICKSDAYELTVNKWTTNDNTVHSGIINNAQLSDEGDYTCSYSIYNNDNARSTELIVLVKPVIVGIPTSQFEFAVGPTVNNYTISYTFKSPGNAIATWYHNDIQLLDRTIHQSHDMGGDSIVQVYQRSHGGDYRVVIESQFNGLQVSNDIKQQSTVEYSFNIEVFVPPSVPMISVMEVTPFEATVSITHTNITPDDAPDQIRLTIADANDVIDIIELEGHHMEYTFNELTPFQQYHVSISVKNADGNKDGETVYITTSTSEPSLSDYNIIRTGVKSFNITLLFNYLGASSINMIRVHYKPVNSIIASPYQFIDITNSFDDLQSLYFTAVFDISEYKKQLVFILEITNNDNKGVNIESVMETIEPLSAPSKPSVIGLTKDSVSLIIQLPLLGTPPITEISYRFSSVDDIMTVNISGDYTQSEQHTLITSEQELVLMSNTRYTVVTRVKNFVGWSNYSDGIEFTTYPADPNEFHTTSAAYENSLPVWAVILSGVIPTITVILIIISSVLFVLLIKKYRKNSKPKGYPINEATAADKNRMDRSPGESRRIAKFFSYDKPLVPRPPTAEPFEMYPYPPSSSHDDSDSETNLTNTPKYKYVVSPTPNEIGIQGFLGSAPGSGTYVYV